MMWDEVMERIKALILADSSLSAIFGTHFRRAAVGNMQIPGIEWTLLGDTENELWAPMLVQFDLWTARAEDNRMAERVLRGLLHRQIMIEVDGVRMFSQYTDGADLAVPNRANYSGRGLRFRFTPLRYQYALPAH